MQDCICILYNWNIAPLEKKYKNLFSFQRVVVMTKHRKQKYAQIQQQISFHIHQNMNLLRIKNNVTGIRPNVVVLVFLMLTYSWADLSGCSIICYNCKHCYFLKMRLEKISANLPRFVQSQQQNPSLHKICENSDFHWPVFSHVP